MKARIENSKQLNAALALACKVTSGASKTLPVLQQVRLTSTSDSVVLGTTDLEANLDSVVQATATELGDCAVSAKALATAIKKLGDKPVDLSLVNSKLEIQSGTRKIQISTSPVSDLPEPEQFTPSGEISVPKERFTTALCYCYQAICTDDTRRHLSVLHVDYRDGVVKFVTTDGHRLHLARAYDFTGGNRSMNVPRSSAKLLLDVLKSGNGSVENLTVSECGGKVRYVVGNHTLTARMADVQFPPYLKVIPASSDTRQICSTEALRNAADLCKAFTEDRNYGIKLEISLESIKITTDSPETGSVAEEISSKRTCWPIDQADKVVKVGVNAEYLIEALKVFGDSVEIGVSEELDPIVLDNPSNPDFKAVVMPIRL